MNTLFKKKIKYYFHLYILKAVVLFLFFVCLNLVGIFSANFSNEVYRFSNGYENDNYYSYTFTNIDDEFTNKIINEIDSKDYALGFLAKSKSLHSHLQLTFYFKGNITQYGLIDENLYLKPDIKSYTALSDEKEAYAITSKNVDGTIVHFDNNTYPISGKMDFILPYFAKKQLESLEYKGIEIILLYNPNISYPVCTSVVIKDNERFVHDNILANPLKSGKELNSEVDLLKGGVTILFYTSFLIIYTFVLIFWTFFFRFIDLNILDDYYLLMTMGLSKRRAERQYFNENMLFALPGYIISLIIFIPIFAFAYGASFYIPLFTSLFSFIYYLLYCFVFSRKTIQKLLKKTKF